MGCKVETSTKLELQHSSMACKNPISVASTVPRLHLTMYLQATTSYRVCRFRFTDQLGAKGHSALETLVYLAVHFYYIIFVYVCISPSRFPASILSNIYRLCSVFLLCKSPTSLPPKLSTTKVQRNNGKTTTKHVF